MNLQPPIVTELLGHSYATYPATGGWQRWPAHLHSFHQFDATLAGSSELHLDGGSVLQATPGTGILIPPMLRHAHRSRSGFQVAMFKFRLSPAVWAPLSRAPLRLTLPPATLNALAAAAEAWETETAWAAEQSAAVLTLCLVEALRAVRPAATASDAERALATGAGDEFTRQLLPVLAQIEADPLKPWSVADLAARCHLTPDHFTKRFQAAFEQGPQDWLRRARMRAAAAALRAEPRVAIKAVAEQAGYATVHSFSRAFREVTGVSPARFRRERGDL